MDSIFGYMTRYDYENVFICQERELGLKAIIAIHDTTLGPAAGGTRVWTYPNEMAAIEDALRLARGMTYKYAAGGANLGGGKCVVIADPKRDKTEGLFRALGRFIHRLGGIFLTGEDVGTTLRDMEYMRLETPYIITLPEAWGGSGPVSPATAHGVAEGIKACAEATFGSRDLKGLRVALQGVGSVGWHVLEQLEGTGAQVLVSDIDPARVKLATERFGVQAVDPDQIHAQEVEIYCPCALGAVINDRTLPELRCKIVAGSANNQLAEERHGDALERMGILYAPDYIINAGGAIWDQDRLNPGGFHRDRAVAAVSRIGEAVADVIRIARTEKIPTYRAADIRAERRIAAVRQAKSLAAQGTLLR